MWRHQVRSNTPVLNRALRGGCSDEVEIDKKRHDVWVDEHCAISKKKKEKISIQLCQGTKHNMSAGVSTIFSKKYSNARLLARLVVSSSLLLASPRGQMDVHCSRASTRNNGQFPKFGVIEGVSYIICHCSNCHHKPS